MVENKTTSRKIPRILYPSDDEDMSDVESVHNESVAEPIAEPVAPEESASLVVPEPCLVTKKKGRPPKPREPTEKPRVIREKTKVECTYCHRVYTQAFSLDKHINDNRCYVKREQDKKEIEDLKAAVEKQKGKPKKESKKEPEPEPIVASVKPKKERKKAEPKLETPRPVKLPPIPVATQFVPQPQKPKYTFKFV